MELIDATQVDKHPFDYDKHNERKRVSAGDLYVAFFSDTHIGYYAYSHTDARGINLREIDGDRALMEITKGIIEDPRVTVVIHGGDFFHRSSPTGRQVKLVQTVLNMFASAGIMVFGQAGNHDVSDMRSDLTSVALLDDPARKIYALWTPYQAYQIADGVFLHSVSHHGLKGDEAPEIKPIANGLNIFSTHGAALDPKNATLMRCADSVREQFIPTEMVIDENFTAKLLGHYHERYSVGGGQFNTWYAGSTVRRGFSDNAGPRGWMLFKVSPNGSLEVENHNIVQRPQFDLDIIDADGLSASDVQDKLAENIAGMGVDLSGGFDQLEAPIVRQRVINAPRSLRAALDRAWISAQTQNMLSWKMEVEAPEVTERKVVAKEGGEDDSSVEGHDHSPTLTSSGSGSAVESFDSWADLSNTLSSVPEANRGDVRKAARKHLEYAESMRGN